MTAGTSNECTTQGAEHAGESALTCRSCGNGELKEILSLGDMPLADRLLTEQMLDEHEPKYPLTLFFCDGCSLVQIGETVEVMPVEIGFLQSQNCFIYALGKPDHGSNRKLIGPFYRPD